MKKLIALLLLSPLAFADKIEFYLSCKILNQAGISINEGKSKIFDYYEGDFPKEGDKIKVTFLYEEKDDQSYSFIISTDYGPMFKSLQFLNNSDFSEIQDDSITDIYRWKNIMGKSLYIDRNTINIEGVSGIDIDLDRYYKNDWQLSAHIDRKNQNFIFSANCLNMSNKFDKFLQRMEKQHPNSSR